MIRWKQHDEWVSESTQKTIPSHPSQEIHKKAEKTLQNRPGSLQNDVACHNYIKYCKSIAGTKSYFSFQYNKNIDQTSMVLLI